MPPAPDDRPLRFGRFEIRPAERTLCVDGAPAVLGARAFDLLLVLARRRERLVGKQELLDLVWPGTVVEEHNITAQISSLRKLLGPRVIATVPGRGYQFVATPDAPAPDAQAVGGASAPPRHNLPEQRTRFIGRAAALADLGRLMAQSRLLTLTGIGGCGKTRLALQFGQSCSRISPTGSGSSTSRRCATPSAWPRPARRRSGSATSPMRRPRTRWRRISPHGKRCSCSTTASTCARAPRRSWMPC